MLDFMMMKTRKDIETLGDQIREGGTYEKIKPLVDQQHLLQMALIELVRMDLTRDTKKGIKVILK